jgi:hypothetical protein
MMEIADVIFRPGLGEARDARNAEPAERLFEKLPDALLWERHA